MSKNTNAKGDASAALDAKGIDWVCEQIVNGEMMTAVARSARVSLNGLANWIAADPERSARAREARKASAAAYDEKAEAGIAEASDPFSLAKAKELAHHYRWKASKLDPRRFGDKLAIGGADDLPPLKAVSDEQLDARIKSLQEKLGVNKG